ncbi:hypothetical protein AJ78_05208 [Emergomyces pasteurianus Ep9510]|uniref:Zn(2)-C6 fungal-type domain-containing protein n=1 Tax=Emergomyces pasteurianus Ep9510 TaxID=1447872 RepID=A0A1J9PCZ2_9EURO|nr:hypothetical protein AJ78_05208 [Emergomyces pasteurianus Ep9510]
MSPGYYEAQEGLQFCRHSTRGMSYPVSRSLRGEAQQELAVGYSNRICSTAEPDVKSNSTSSRRRIPVACGRCRRRKIRCSGDSGNGQCTNCRNAGTQGCQFLRVNSFTTHARSHCGSAWPYPATAPLSDAYVGNTGYETQATSKANSISIHSMAPNLPLYSKSQCTYEQAAQFGPLSRSHYISACRINYDGDSASYSLPSPPYMLPSTDSAGSSSYCSYAGSPRSSQVGKISNEDIYHDQHGHSTLGSNYGYISQAQTPVSVSSDVSSALPLLNAMASSPSGPDRILPNPAVSRNSSENRSAMRPPSAEGSLPSSDGASTGLNGRSISHLALDSVSSSSQQSTMRTTSTTMTNSANSPSTKKPLISPTEMGFGYVISNNSPSATITATTFPTTESVAGFDSIAENALGGPPHRCSDLRQHSSCGSQSYDHSTALSAGGSSGNLSNGKAYTRLPHYEPSASRCSEPAVKLTTNLLVHKTDNF